LLVTSFGFGQTNDNCSGAISLTPSADNTCNPTTGSTVGATQSQPGCTGTADDDVWYSFVATSTDHIITVTDGTLYDSVLQLFTGTCGSLGTINGLCRDNQTVNETLSVTGFTVGTTYY